MKIFIGKFITLILALLLLIQSFVYINGVHEWYVWWSNGKSPLTTIGYVSDLVIKRGKHSNDIKIITVVNKSDITSIEANFKIELLEYLSAYKDKIHVQYYPRASGIYAPIRISDKDENILYQNEVYEGIILSVVVLLAAMLFLLGSLFSLMFTIGKLKFDND